jgi:multidrug efflux pump subunit AcrA (membrane-fusion protein)
MRILIAVFKDLIIFFNYKTKVGKRRLAILLLILLIAILGIKIFGNGASETVEPEAKRAEVSVLSVAELGSSASFDTVGKVEAVSEANLQTETGGRITAVNVKVGDQVRAGSVLATLENSAQRAMLVQAQGSYEAALAASAQSGVGVDQAKTGVTAAENAAVNVFRQANNTVTAAISNNIDVYYSNPQSSLPGLRLSGGAWTSEFISERVAFQQILPEFQGRSNTISTNSNLESELAYAKKQVEHTISFVDLFISVLNKDANGERYTEAELQALNTNFTALRSSLIGTRSSIDGALSGLESAKDGARRAELSASGGQVSASDAQVKMALGSLQSAQSNYQKTIVRTPISGVVNALYLKTGDYASPNQPAAIVANNNGLQIKTFVSEIDSANLNVGDVVTIEGGSTGVITAKAAALDPSNGKVAVVVGVDANSGLTNGATVKVTFSQISETKTSEKILVPLSALKITASGSLVFTVNEQGALVAVPVTQGQLYGENIEILTGVTKETRIVTDARGLKEGQLVTVK